MKNEVTKRLSAAEVLGLLVVEVLQGHLPEAQEIAREIKLHWPNGKPVAADFASPERDTNRPQGWQWTHERDAELIRRDGMMCEQHPGKEFPHDDCAGPGQAWAVEGKDAIRSILSEVAHDQKRSGCETRAIRVRPALGETRRLRQS